MDENVKNLLKIEKAIFDIYQKFEEFELGDNTIDISEYHGLLHDALKIEKKYLNKIDVERYLYLLQSDLPNDISNYINLYANDSKYYYEGKGEIEDNSIYERLFLKLFYLYTLTNDTNLNSGFVQKSINDDVNCEIINSLSKFINEEENDVVKNELIKYKYIYMYKADKTDEIFMLNRSNLANSKDPFAINLLYQMEINSLINRGIYTLMGEGTDKNIEKDILVKTDCYVALANIQTAISIATLEEKFEIIDQINKSVSNIEPSTLINNSYSLTKLRKLIDNERLKLTEKEPTYKKM